MYRTPKFDVLSDNICTIIYAFFNGHITSNIQHKLLYLTYSCKKRENKLHLFLSHLLFCTFSLEVRLDL